MSTELHIVTGAFGFTGRYIASRLLEKGHRVRTLTNSPDRPNPFEEKIEVHPYNFDHPDKLTESMRGASVLYNAYWVRFDHPQFTFAEAVANSLKLFKAAADAGVQRIVHISITNPSLSSPLPYFRGKAQLEETLYRSPLSHAILRPAVIFGSEDILINNIVWGLRNFPIFPMFGNGQYKLQPIYVDDLARLAVEQGQRRENVTLDAIGPDTFTYKQLVQDLSVAIGVHRPIIPLPPIIAYVLGWFIGSCVGDVMITRDEIRGLMNNLLYTNSSPIGTTRLTDWLRDNTIPLGCQYNSELQRRLDRTAPLVPPR